MLRILSFGNSFSDDSHRWLYDLACAAGVEIETHDYVIGGCPLEWHAQNLRSGEGKYLYQKNGIYDPDSLENPRRFRQGLEDGRWDIITIQQVSHLAGKPESNQPYLNELLAAIRKAQPQAKIYFHQTWEYEYCSEHPGFPDYGCDCDTMYAAVRANCRNIAREHALGLIPTGEAVHAAKRLSAFDSEHDGISLYRDAFHMGWVYGRYLAACVWLKTLCGVLPAADAFIPAQDGVTADPALLAQLLRTAEETVREHSILL
ncbi:MAG: DUF4886 domain-containing protein [Oscillospiraceae bacterium]|nr:DUF4886 domain-containing protein [Oscillospiraceae bacterium]